jgi:membrane protein
MPYQLVARNTTSIVGKYLADRGPHLGAMVAYYALLALFPFVFLILSTLGLFGQVSESSFLIKELKRILPAQSEDSLIAAVDHLQDNARWFFWIGLLGMFWSALGFYSALESALNIIFRVSNRGFLKGKGLGIVFVLGSLTVLFVSLSIATTIASWFDRHAPHDGIFRTLSIVIPTGAAGIGSFVFLFVVYRVLTNVELHRGDVWPGALFGAVLFAISFQAVPLYLRFATNLVSLQVFGGIVILLVWLYLMANIILIGAEINWRHWSRNQPSEEVTGLA